MENSDIFHLLPIDKSLSEMKFRADAGLCLFCGLKWAIAKNTICADCDEQRSLAFLRTENEQSGIAA